MSKKKIKLDKVAGGIRMNLGEGSKIEGDMSIKDYSKEKEVVEESIYLKDEKTTVKAKL